MSDNSFVENNLLIQIYGTKYTGAPFELGEGKNKYLSFFQNMDGERWIFGIDNQGRAFLSGDAIDWDVQFLGGGVKPVSDVPVDNEVSVWLFACWAATRSIRLDADLEVPGDVLTFPAPAELWGISETTFKRDANPKENDPPKLKASKVGGVWLVTARAMVEMYGLPTGVRGTIVQTMISTEQSQEKKRKKRGRVPKAVD